MLLVTVALLYKVVTSPLEFDLSNFDFSDFLALVLAVFAIWLSIALYHRGSEVANRFYHEMHMFTSRTAEILGNIQGSFGEALRHIGERVDRMPIDVEQTEADITAMQAEKEAIAKAKDEIESQRQKIIEEFSKRAPVEHQRAVEVEKFARQLEETTKSLEEKERELRAVTNQMEAMRADAQVQMQDLKKELARRDVERGSVLSYLADGNRHAVALLSRRLPNLTRANRSEADQLLSAALQGSSDESRDRLRRAGLLTSDDKFTDAGLYLVRVAQIELLR
jgi:chromosome segregation ATPase